MNVKNEALDRRLNAYRPDLADVRLKGKVEATRFVEGERRRVRAASAPLKRRPNADASLDSELLCGEVFHVFGEPVDGWTWGQSQTDSYVGYVPEASLGPAEPAPTHRVSALRTFVYSGPDMKLPAVAALSMGSLVALRGSVETRGTSYRELADGKGAVVASHFTAIDAPPEKDFVAVAKRFINTPYLWGGRTSLGLDCSALVQVALMMAGKPALRDTDLQRETLGDPVEGGIDGSLRRGDLLFWPGHVGILADEATMIHASGHHMAVVTEPLAGALGRIGPPTRVRRVR